MDNDDEDLMSIVRSCSKVNGPPKSTPSSSSLSPLPMAFPGIATTTQQKDFLALEEICMPFFSRPQQQHQPPPLQKPQPAGRSKKRKKQQKKIVTHVPADSIPSDDVWSWRKYGQKPIKGSPYPRGYYRCSTSKSCPARKQVEKSCADPGMLTVSYSEEHNHPLPTHRSSLAGTTRSRFSPPSGVGPSAMSPTPPMTSSSEEEEDELLGLEDMEIAAGEETAVVTSAVSKDDQKDSAGGGRGGAT